MAGQRRQQPKIFLSYARGTTDYAEWVLGLAAGLQSEGFTVIMDILSKNHAESWNAFMLRSIREADRVLIMCTREYKKRADRVQANSGVGTESVIAISEFYQNPAKFVPILAEAAPSEELVPSYLTNWDYYNLATPDQFQTEYARLVSRLHGQPLYRLGRGSSRRSPPKVIPPIEHPYAAQSPSQAVARATQGVARAISTVFETDRTQASPHPKRPLLEMYVRGLGSDPHKGRKLRGADLVSEIGHSHNRLAVVLGEFGSGKSVFAYQLASGDIAPNALVIPCRSAPVRRGQTSLIRWCAAAFKAGHPKLGLSSEQARDAVEHVLGDTDGLVVVDGIDELQVAEPAGIETVLRRWFRECQGFNTRVVFTARNTLVTLLRRVMSEEPGFAAVEEEQEAIEVGTSGTMYEICALTESDIVEYVTRSVPGERGAEIAAKLLASRYLIGFARRPVFLHLLTKHPDTEDSLLGVYHLLQKIIDAWAVTHRVPEEDVEDVRHALEDFAVHLWVSNARSAPVAVLERTLLGHGSSPELSIYQCSFLTVDPFGQVSFAHNVFLEFLVARKLAAELTGCSNQLLYASPPLPDAAAYFLVSRLDSEMGPTPRDVQDEDRVAVIADRGFDELAGEAVPTFHIDRHAVSCRDYLMFLRDNPRMCPPAPESRSTLEWLGSREDPDWVVGDVDAYLQAVERWVWPDRTAPPAGHEDMPVNYVSYFDAWVYARWVGGRLPTFVEWAKAAGWDPDHHTLLAYPWGNEASPAVVNCADGDDGRRGLAPVSAYAEGSSPYGCVQMSGNVAEWTRSRMSDDSPFLVIAGGAWMLPMDQCRVDRPARSLPSIRRNFVGFRVVYDDCAPLTHGQSHSQSP